MSVPTVFSKAQNKLVNAEPLTGEDYAALAQHENALPVHQRKYVRFTYSEFLNSLGQDKSALGSNLTILQNAMIVESRISVNGAAIGNIYKTGSSGTISDSDVYEHNLNELSKLALNGNEPNMWNVYYSAIANAVFNPNITIETQVHGFILSSMPATKGKQPIPEWKSAVKDAVNNLVPGFGSGGKTYRDLVSAPNPKAPPPTAGFSNTEITSGSLKQINKVISQCALLHNLQFIADAYDLELDAYKAKAKTVYFNNTLFKIDSSTPDTILNSLILGSSSAGDIFDYHTGIYLDESTPYFDVDLAKNVITASIAYQNQLKSRKDWRTTLNRSHITFLDEGKSYVPFHANVGSQNFPWSGDEKIDIEYNGTNPSTARSDIKVNYTRDISEIGKVFQNKDFKKRAFKYISRQGQDINNLGSFYNNVYRQIKGKKTIFNSITSQAIRNGPSEINTITYGIDLSLVKHEINLKEELAAAEMKLEHRGFQETLLTSPYLDVLGGRDLLEERRKVENNIIKKLFENNCARSDIREAEGNFRDYNRFKLLEYKQRILKRLVDLGRINKFHSNKDYTTIYTTGSYKPASAITGAPSGTKVIFGIPATTGSLPTSGSLPKGTATRVPFFYFGDFVSVCMEMFYKTPYTNSSFHEEDKYSNYDLDFYENLQPISLSTPFEFTPIGGSKAVKVNIANIPISVGWYATFMDEQYFSKSVEHIPIGQILRDMLEIGVSSMLTDICFSEYLENRLQFRVTSHKGSKHQFKQFKNLYDYNGTTAQHLRTEDDIKAKLDYPLFSADPVDGTEIFYEQKDVNYHSYIYLHAQDPLESGPTYQQKLLERVVDKTIPVIKNLDASTKPYLFVKNFSWSKVENKYERERRYFNSNSFTPYVLGNVYNCTVKTTFMVPFLYPGMIVALDPYLGSSNANAFQRYRDKHTDPKAFGELTGSAGWQLGLTGFYLISKVKHSINNSKTTGMLNGTTEIECKNILGMESVIHINPERTRDCDKYVALSENLLSTTGLGPSNTDSGESIEGVDKVNAPPPTEEEVTAASGTGATLTNSTTAGVIISAAVDEIKGIFE